MGNASKFDLKRRIGRKHHQHDARPATMARREVGEVLVVADGVVERLRRIEESKPVPESALRRCAERSCQRPGDRHPSLEAGDGDTLSVARASLFAPVPDDVSTALKLVPTLMYEERCGDAGKKRCAVRPLYLSPACAQGGRMQATETRHGSQTVRLC